MPLTKRRLSGQLPPTVDPSGNEILDWRMERAEQVIDSQQDRHDSHSERLDKLEARPGLDLTHLPWLQIVGLLILLGLGATGRVSPEAVDTILKLLPGR